MFNLSVQLNQTPAAFARIEGSDEHPEINGIVRFFETNRGVLVSAQIQGLPSPSEPCKSPVFGFHIHTGDSCTGNETDPFADAMTHYNPEDCPHPYHAGDLPPLFGSRGAAVLVVLTDRFSIKEILGRTVIIHANPDDFTTQPAGNAGMKIACRVVQSRGV